MLVLGFKLRTGLSQENRWECWFLSVEQGQALCTSHFAVAIVRTTPSFLLEMIPKRSGDPSWLGLSEGWDRRFRVFCWKNSQQEKDLLHPKSLPWWYFSGRSLLRNWWGRHMGCGNSEAADKDEGRGFNSYHSTRTQVVICNLTFPWTATYMEQRGCHELKRHGPGP